MKHILPLLLLGLSLSAQAQSVPAIAGNLTISPASLTLTRLHEPHSLIVMGRTAGGHDVDLSLTTKWTSSNEAVARVDSQGWVSAVTNGQVTLTGNAAGKSVQVSVSVKLPPAVLPLSFRHDVMPVLSKGGCNAGACHGYSLGKNGFKLSLRGSDPALDFPAVTEDFFERRINRHNPPASLLLLKPLGDLAHEGGVRFDSGSLSHTVLRTWIAQGAKDDAPALATLQSVRIHPAKVVAAPKARQQFQVIARYSDGTERDVTRMAIFEVNTERVARVDEAGLVAATGLGETAVAARYERIFAVANFIVLSTDTAFKPAAVPMDNLVDRHVTTKLNDLRIEASPVVDDERFLRRAYVDLIGVQPKPDEVLAFIADVAPDKRAKAIERLLSRTEFVDWWSLRWGDLLQNSRNTTSDPGMYAFREWIRTSVAANKPMDQFAREILTARGAASDNPAAAWFAASKDADDSLQRSTQVFAGVRMLCAKCHPHPFENWTQADYYGLHSFFNQVSTKQDPRLPAVANAKSVLVNLQAGLSTNPRTGQAQPPRYLGGAEPKLGESVDRRLDYARWLTAPDNAHFARSLANRFWSYFFHRGIIDPVDDVRATNPPINAALLDALAADFAKQNFDMRHLIRTIVNSRTYQRSAATTSSNAHDDANFSHAIPRRLPAEALLDSLVQATGVPESFGGAPTAFTAAQLPDANFTSEFLSLFGKAQRMEACECERDTRSNMLQALDFINGRSILTRVAAANGRPALLLGPKPTDDALIDQLHLWALARRPTDAERVLAQKFFKEYGDKRAEAAQDFFWGLLNSRDFMLLY